MKRTTYIDGVEVDESKKVTRWQLFKLEWSTASSWFFPKYHEHPKLGRLPTHTKLSALWQFIKNPRRTVSWWEKHGIDDNEWHHIGVHVDHTSDD